MDRSLLIVILGCLEFVSEMGDLMNLTKVSLSFTMVHFVVVFHDTLRFQSTTIIGGCHCRCICYRALGEIDSTEGLVAARTLSRR